MKIAICDDCLEDIEYLKKLIQASKMCPANVEFAEFASGEDLLSSHSNFDAIFLDMQMEGMDGKETAREIRKRDSNVVLSFYSAFTENAHNVLDFRPLKYLLKDSQEQKISSDIDQILSEVIYKNRITQIRIQHYNTMTKLKLTDILYISLSGKGSLVWIIQERAKELREARKEPEGWVLKSSLCLNNHYLELKDSGFVYASKSYIVNAEKIIKQSNGEIILEGGQTLSLTRGMKKSFEAEVARYWNLKYKETRVEEAMDLSTLDIMPFMYLNCVFEIFLLHTLLGGLFQDRGGCKAVKVLKAAACITIMIIVNSFRLPWLNLVCVPIIYYAFARLNFLLELKYAILYIIIFYMILAGTEFAFSYAYKLFGINVTLARFGRIFILTIQDIFEFVIIQLVIRQHRAPYEGGSYRYLKTLFILPIATLILLNGHMVPNGHYKVGYFLICTGGILLVVSIMVNFSIVERLLGTLNEAKNEEMLNMKTHLERIHIQVLEDLNRDYAKNIHEMKHMLRTLHKLAYENEDEIVRELSMKLLSGRFQAKEIYSADPVTNAIVWEREEMARDYKVDFKVDIEHGLNLDFVEDVDKIMMFGNLLDNALEAAATVEREGYVSVSFYMGNGALVIIRVENNFKIKPRKLGKEYLTTKKVKMEHGFGLNIVKELSEKYGGMFNTTENETTFTAFLLLSNIQSMSNTEK